jgi:hypothetical protein
MATHDKRTNLMCQLLNLTFATPNRGGGRMTKSDLASSCFGVCARSRPVCIALPSSQVLSGSKTGKPGVS